LTNIDRTCPRIGPLLSTFSKDLESFISTSRSLILIHKTQLRSNPNSLAIQSSFCADSPLFGIKATDSILFRLDWIVFDSRGEEQVC